MPNPTTVRWIGRARCAALAVPCPYTLCTATIGDPCHAYADPKQLCEPHRERRDYAHLLGFRDVAPAGELFGG
jgi:hypothetical protein